MFSSLRQQNANVTHVINFSLSRVLQSDNYNLHKHFPQIAWKWSYTSHALEIHRIYWSVNNKACSVFTVPHCVINIWFSDSVWKWVFERDQVCGLLVDEKRGFLWELLFGKQEEHICEQYTRNFNCRTFRIVILEYGYGKGATGVYQEKDRQMNTMQISESG